MNFGENPGINQIWFIMRLREKNIACYDPYKSEKYNGYFCLILQFIRIKLELTHLECYYPE